MKKALQRRRMWEYLNYSAFVRGTEAEELPPLESADWVPPAVVEEAKKINAEAIVHKDPIEAKDLLSRLLNDDRMKTVWREFYKTKRINHKATPEYVTPLGVTNMRLVEE